MDRKSVAYMVNLTGGSGAAWPSHRPLRRPHAGRFLTFTEPWWTRATDPGYPVPGR